MKRVLLSIFVFLMLITVAGCGSGNSNSGTVPGGSGEATVQDDSFDINRIYGRWAEENGDRILTISSQKIKLTSGSSSTSTSGSNLKTDKDTLYISLNNVRDMKIEEKEDGTLRIFNDEYSFIQKENWSEAEPVPETPTEIKMGDTISTDFAEIVFDEDDIVDEIKISNTTGGGGGYGGHITITQVIEQEESGKKFIYLRGTVKNIGTYPMEPDNMKAKLIINDKYELDGKVSVVTEGAERVRELDPLNSAIIILDTGIDSSAVADINKLVWQIGFEQSFSGDDKGEPKGSRYYYQIPVK